MVQYEFFGSCEGNKYKVDGKKECGCERLNGVFIPGCQEHTDDVINPDDIPESHTGYTTDF